ncbi:MAG TPA: hypothetical protein VMV80_00300 [Anaerolineales bacterium]|nr:hypothetical protein [Anaerolineales bacterium]HUV91502.1 hypothetical protein [Anaerolineales bacterium]
MQLSARAYHRVLKLARTIADLAGDMNIVLNTWPRRCCPAKINPVLKFIPMPVFSRDKLEDINAQLSSSQLLQQEHKPRLNRAHHGQGWGL